MCNGIRVHNSFNVLLLPLNTITGLKEAYRKMNLEGMESMETARTVDVMPFMGQGNHLWLVVFISRNQ